MRIRFLSTDYKSEEKTVNSERSANFRFSHRRHEPEIPLTRPSAFALCPSPFELRASSFELRRDKSGTLSPIGKEGRGEGASRLMGR